MTAAPFQALTVFRTVGTVPASEAVDVTPPPLVFKDDGDVASSPRE